MVRERRVKENQIVYDYIKQLQDQISEDSKSFQGESLASAAFMKSPGHNIGSATLPSSIVQTGIASSVQGSVRTSEDLQKRSVEETQTEEESIDTNVQEAMNDLMSSHTTPRSNKLRNIY